MNVRKIWSGPLPTKHFTKKVLWKKYFQFLIPASCFLQHTVFRAIQEALWCANTETSGSRRESRPSPLRITQETSPELSRGLHITQTGYNTPSQTTNLTVLFPPKLAYSFCGGILMPQKTYNFSVLGLY